MKEENRSILNTLCGSDAAEPRLTKQVEVCAFHNLSHRFLCERSVKFLFLFFFVTFDRKKGRTSRKILKRSNIITVNNLFRLVSLR